MGKLKPEEVAAREHFTRWFLYFRAEFYARDIRFAKDLDVSRSLVSDVVAGNKQVGFDVALRMRAVFRRTLEELAFGTPPAASLTGPPIHPSRASSSATAETTRRRHGGAK